MKEKDERESPDEDVNSPGGRKDTGEQPSPARNENTDEEEDMPNPRIEPVEKKVGESRDNLRRREAWFRRRSGTGK